MPTLCNVVMPTCDAKPLAGSAVLQNGGHAQGARVLCKHGLLAGGHRAPVKHGQGLQLAQHRWPAWVTA
eukprot:scaffold219006_cov36-Tisochrysis_lutea.AAC.1